MALMKIVALDGHTLNPGDLSREALRAMGELQVFDRSADKKTRYIGVLFTGYDVVDVKAARELGIGVTNVPTYGTASAADLLFALLLELRHQAGGVHGEPPAPESGRDPRISACGKAGG